MFRTGISALRNRACCPTSTPRQGSLGMLVGIRRLEHDAPQQVRALLAGAGASESDDLVKQDAAVLRRDALVDHFINGVGLHASHEVHPTLGPLTKQAIVVVA